MFGVPKESIKQPESCCMTASEPHLKKRNGVLDTDLV